MLETEKTRKIRVKYYDGMGDWEYEYHCSKCKTLVKSEQNFCHECGADINELEIRDSWGL